MAKLRKSLPPTSKAFYAYQEILKFITRENLEPGSKLPTHSELRKRLKLSHNAINLAMQQLIQDGVLTRKPKIGTILVDPSQKKVQTQTLLWKIALLMPSPANEARFLDWVMHHCAIELQNRSCIPFFYHAEKDDPYPQLRHYSRLSQDIEMGKIDGIIAGAIYDPVLSLPCVTITDIGYCSYVKLDFFSFAREAIQKVIQKGYRSMGWVLFANSNWDYWFRLALSMMRHDYGNIPDPWVIMIQPPCGQHFQAGQEAARNFLTHCPIDQRPEVWILCEDVTASGFIDVLAKQEDYRPEFIVATNQELRIHFTLPVYRYEFSLSKLAKSLVDVLYLSFDRSEVVYRFQSIKGMFISEEPAQ